ncbi:MAG: ribonuclease P protein component [Rikenellaceae bacterium]|nr:ribonuclease P protein component [Rikenellaceae bacterium]
MKLTDNTFGKRHKLCNKTLLEQLFADGASVSMFSYPFRLVYMLTDPDPDSENVQVVITVSKRNHKRAVDRNLIKRRIREAYRINKSLWHTNRDGSFVIDGKRVLVAFVYTSKDILDFKTIENGIRKGIRSICKNIEKNSGIPVRDAD